MARLSDALQALTPTEFEELCAAIAKDVGLTNVTTRKAGSQDGRDIDAILPAAKAASKTDEKWLFECKRYEGTVPFSEIIVKLYQIQYLRRFSPRALVILSSGALSNDTHDFLENYAADLSFPILCVTNDLPEQRFDKLLLERLAAVNAYLASKGKPPLTVPPGTTSPPAGTAMAQWLADQAQGTGQRARVERALSLHAYPHISASWTGIDNNWASVTLHIVNIGNGFAQRLELRVVHKGDVVAEYDLNPLQAGGFLNNWTIHTTIKPSNLPKPNEEDHLDLAFTYENALGHQFQSLVRIEAWMQGGQRTIKSLRLSSKRV